MVVRKLRKCYVKRANAYSNHDDSVQEHMRQQIFELERPNQVIWNILPVYRLLRDALCCEPNGLVQP